MSDKLAICPTGEEIMAQPNWFRVCVGCGQARHKKELLRIVRCQDNYLEIDFDQKKPGRGAYICPNTECAMLAKKKHGFNRPFLIEVDSVFYNQIIQVVR
jgi:predicted RNA-binding protein YlxR (DUF448 family)